MSGRDDFIVPFWKKVWLSFIVVYLCVWKSFLTFRDFTICTLIFVKNLEKRDK